MPKQLVTQFEFDSPNLLDGYESNGSPLKDFLYPMNVLISTKNGQNIYLI